MRYNGFPFLYTLVADPDRMGGRLMYNAAKYRTIHIHDPENPVKREFGNSRVLGKEGAGRAFARPAKRTTLSQDPDQMETVILRPGSYTRTPCWKGLRR